MVGKFFLMLLLAFLPCVSGQDERDVKVLSEKYSGKPLQLSHQKKFSTQPDGKLMLHIVLKDYFGKEQKLTRDLKNIWRSAVSNQCGGKFKGRPKLSFMVSSCAGYYDETRRRWNCPDTVAGVHGYYSCIVGS